MTKHSPDRRVSLVSDRRRATRGGRRCTDDWWSSPPRLVACTDCANGAADLMALTSEGVNTTLMVTYRCRDCGRRFDRIAE